MKTKSVLAYVLSFAMLFGIAPCYAAAGYDSRSSNELQLNRQMTLYADKYQSSADGSLLSENYMLYSPGKGVIPTVMFGNDIRGAASYAAAAEIEAGKGKNIVAGINGDFFTTATGVCMGICVRDGIVCSSERSGSFESIGFTGDGHAKIGRVDLSVELTDDSTGKYLPYLSFNKDLTRNVGFVLFSSDYGETNAAKEESRNVLIRIESGEARIGERIFGTVEAVFSAAEPVSIPDGYLLLSILAATQYTSAIPAIDTFQSGDRISVSFSAEGDWDEYPTILGADCRLVQNGSIVENAGNGRAPRSAFGIKRNGEQVFYTVDGRNSSVSSGMTLHQLAERMQDLGCVEAVNLDGGGSTQLHVNLPGTDDPTLINTPSETPTRRCANYLVFCDQNESSGKAQRIHLYPFDQPVTISTGSKLTLVASDEYYHPAALPGDAVFEVSDGMGSVDSEGIFTAAGNRSGSAVIQVRCGRYSASLNVNVVTEGRALYTFEQWSLDGVYGAAAASVNTALSYVHNGLRSEKISYDFDLLDEAGNRQTAFVPIGYNFPKAPSMMTLWVYGDGSGNAFTADVTANGILQKLPLTNLDFTGWKQLQTELPAGITRLEGFEIIGDGQGEIYLDQIIAGYGYYKDDLAPEISITAENGRIHGTISDEIDEAIAKENISFSMDGERIAFSYNSKSKEFQAVVDASDGLLHHIILDACDRSGNYARSSISYQELSDSVITGNIFSDMPAEKSGTPYAEYLFRTGVTAGKNKNGKLCFDPDTGITRQEFAAMVIRWLGTDTTLYEDTELPFTDAGKISAFALPAVKAAVSMGMINGKPKGDQLIFDPKGTLTRQEAVAILGRIMKKGYDGDDLSAFSDASSIASYAVPYFKVFVKQGMIAGNDGKLNPRTAVTREEVAIMLFGLS